MYYESSDPVCRKSIGEILEGCLLLYSTIIDEPG